MWLYRRRGWYDRSIALVKLFTDPFLLPLPISMAAGSRILVGFLYTHLRLSDFMINLGLLLDQG